MTLNLRIMNATNLAAKDISGTSDPYVKVMLLPDKKRKLTTNIKRRNLNPRWNEQFAFEGKLLTFLFFFVFCLFFSFALEGKIYTSMIFEGRHEVHYRTPTGGSK